MAYAGVFAGWSPAMSTQHQGGGAKERGESDHHRDRQERSRTLIKR